MSEIRPLLKFHLPVPYRCDKKFISRCSFEEGLTIKTQRVSEYFGSVKYIRKSFVRGIEWAPLRSGKFWLGIWTSKTLTSEYDYHNTLQTTAKRLKQLQQHYPLPNKPQPVMRSRNVLNRDYDSDTTSILASDNDSANENDDIISDSDAVVASHS